MTLDEYNGVIGQIDDQVSKINIALTLTDPVDLLNVLTVTLQDTVAGLELVEV